MKERRYHFTIVRNVNQPHDKYMNYKLNHLHLSIKMMVDFSLSAVIFATPNFHYRKFFLRHAVDFGESFEAGVIVLSELRVT